MDIPEKFNLLGREITVEFCDDLAQKEDLLGSANYRADKIRLQRSVDGYNVPGKQTEHVFCHELMHWLFEFIGREDLQKDEALIDMLGGLLHQALDTMQYGGETKRNTDRSSQDDRSAL